MRSLIPFRLRSIGAVLAPAVALALTGIWLAQESFAQESRSQENPGAMFAASDGKGHISLLWFPSASQWPAGGWRLMDSSGKVLAPQIDMGDAAALQSLSLEDADAIRRLPTVLSHADTNPAQRKQLVNILGLRAFSEPDFARALGLSWSLDKVAPGSRIYKIQGLDASGKVTGFELASPAIDAAQATPLPSAPDQVEAKVSERGVGLSWTAPAQNRRLPVIAYRVERSANGQSATTVTAKPVVAGAHFDPHASLMLDRAAPPNEMLTYQVFSIDVFGRRSAPGSIRIFYPDFRALIPPDPVQATPGPGRIVVSWKAADKPNLTGYIVERSFLESGPYEALMAQALPAGTGRYEDDSLRGGTAYYYRVRAISPRGDLGRPSQSAMAQPSNPGKPPKVAGLAADPGETRVRLTWQPVAFPVAGYFVERRATSSNVAAAVSWARLNPHVTPEAIYDDYIGSASATRLEYRVVAIAFDNGEGLPSDPVDVTLPNRTLPDQPSITGATGADGKVQLNFVPADPLVNTAQFLVLRSGNPTDIGVVLGDPLPGSARQFEDLYVSPGESYWYRLVAVDKDGNRSDPTAPVVIRVRSTAIARPAAPSAHFAASPYPHVVVQFAKPPVGLAAVLERQTAAEAGWIRVAGPVLDQASLTDNVPPDSRPVTYRVTYISADGRVGPASDAVTVSAK